MSDVQGFINLLMAHDCKIEACRMIYTFVRQNPSSAVKELLLGLTEREVAVSFLLSAIIATRGYEEVREERKALSDHTRSIVASHEKITRDAVERIQ